MTLTIASAADDGFVGYRGFDEASSYIAPVTLFVAYGDGSIHFVWNENLNPTQASILAEIRNVSSVVVWSEAINVSGATNNRSHFEVLAGRTDGPFTFSLKIYDGADQTGTLLATGEAEPFDVTGMDYIESNGGVINNLHIGYGAATGSTDPDHIYASKSWMRYTNVAIPQGATIVNATLTLQAIGSEDSVATLIQQFSAEDVDDATTNPSSLTDFNSRAVTTALAHESHGAWDPGITYDADVTSIIQEIVDRAGWVSGNALMMFWELGTAGTAPIHLNNRFFTASDFPSLSAAELTIQYGLEGVGSASGTSTATAVTQFGSTGTATGHSEAQAFTGFGQEVVGSAAGTSDASGVGAADFNSVGTAAGVGDADGAEGRAGSDSVGTASGVGDADGAVSEVEFLAVGTSAGTSTVTGDATQSGSGIGSSAGIGTASGVGESQAESVGSSAGTGDASGVSEATKESVGSAAGVGDADGAVGLAGSDSVGSATGVAASSGVGSSEAESVGSAAGTSDANGVREVLVEAVGSSAGQATVLGGGGWLVFTVGSAAGSSSMEARPLSIQQKWLNDLSDHLGSRKVGHDSIRFVELDGARIIEPTAFEPDPATYRDTHYYNALTNTLYMKVITREEPGIVVAHWQKVSN
jgi:hypothetical protein